MGAGNFKQIEARLVLTADPSRMVRGLEQARAQLARIGAGVNSIAGVQAATTAFEYLREGLQLVAKEYERVRTAAVTYSRDAAQASAELAAAELRRDVAIARAAGGSVAQTERASARLADLEAKNPDAASAMARGYGELKNIGAGAWQMARRFAANDKPIETMREIDNAIVGGAPSVQAPSAWDVMVQLLRDIRSELKNGGG